MQKALDIYDFVARKNLWTGDAMEFWEQTVGTWMLDINTVVDFDDNLILSTEFNNSKKLKCVYDKLAGDNSSLFKDTVGAFVGNREVNLILTIGDCKGASGACAQTQYAAETGIITINFENINETPIEIAQMIIHEAIHAELAKYVLEHDSTVDTNDKPRLFEIYKFYRE